MWLELGLRFRLERVKSVRLRSKSLPCRVPFGVAGWQERDSLSLKTSRS